MKTSTPPIKSNFKVLIIEDHPFVLEVYKNVLQNISSSNELLNFIIDTADNCNNAFIKIKNAAQKKNVDIVFLDIRLPPSENSKILSGEDLGIKINELLPNSKIIISTSLNDNFRIQSLLKTINPDGFLVKNDLTIKILKEAILEVINNPPYYSNTVLNLLRKQSSNDVFLDKIDRELLYQLSLGTKMKDMPKILPLSIAGIEKKKRHLIKIFNVKTSDDKNLLFEAKKKGFI